MLRTLQVILLLMSTSAYAAHYIGLSAGVNQLYSHYRFKNVINTSPFPMHITDYSNPNIGDINPAIGILYGIDNLFGSNPQLFGVEFRLDYVPMNNRNYGSSTAKMDMPEPDTLARQDTHDVRLINDINAELVGMYRYILSKDTALVLGLGLELTKFKARVIATGQERLSDGSYIVATPYVHHFSKTRVGALADVGLESQVAQKTRVRLSYRMSYFGEFVEKDRATVNYIDDGQPQSVVLDHIYRFRDLKRGLFSISIIHLFHT